MSKLKQRYLKEVKSFFPIMGKPERRHLKKLSEQINDYCLEKEVFSIDDLYQDFGRPSEISNTYFSNIDINDFVKRIQLSKWLKRGIAIFLLIALIAVTVYSIDSYCAYKVFERESIYFEETEIILQQDYYLLHFLFVFLFLSYLEKVRPPASHRQNRFIY